jgi:uncharacterized metal-binding protein
MDMDSNLVCAGCAAKWCEFPDTARPARCSQDSVDGETREQVAELYADPDNLKLMAAAAKVSDETRFNTRVQDTMKFAKFIGARKIGIATCTMLLRESRILAGLLERAGFEVAGIACKVDGRRREDLGIENPQGKTNVLCNPVMQARLLNRERTDLNVVMGLCVGHDSLFYRHSEAPVTTLVAKDFITGNNPCAALYASGSLYKRSLDATVETLREE